VFTAAKGPPPVVAKPWGAYIFVLTLLCAALSPRLKNSRPGEATGEADARYDVRQQQVGELLAMTASADKKRAAVMRLVRKGLLTIDEAAGLASTSSDLIQYWAQREGLDIPTTRATYLLRIWRSQLVEEEAGQWSTAQELNAKQMRLDREGRSRSTAVALPLQAPPKQ
jgi:hypothetical protein